MHIQTALMDMGPNPRIFTTYYWRAAAMYPWEEVFQDIKKEFDSLQHLYNREINNKHKKERPLTDQEKEMLELIGYQENLDQEKIHSCHSAAGRPPIDFWACLKACMLAWSLRTDQSITSVYLQLYSNEDFAVACGFHKNIPSYRALARFDQIMTMGKLWEKVRIRSVTINFDKELIKPETSIATDTTHVEADSTLTPEDSKEKPTCDNVGVLRKSKTVTYIAHKMSVPTLPKQSIPLAAYAYKGNTADNLTLESTLIKLFCDYPFLLPYIDAVLCDGIFQTEDNHLLLKELLGHNVRLICPVHPRSRKDVKVEGVNGIVLIDKYGIPHCISGHKLILLGRDKKHQCYIWGCPVFNDKCRVEGLTCSDANHVACCNRSGSGRYFCVNRWDTPQINWEFPQHSKNHQAAYNLRKANERAISFLKEATGFRRLRKRNRINAQAHGDKCVAAFHIMIMMAHIMKRPDLMRSYSKILIAT